jgi:hypothetical protein
MADHPMIMHLETLQLEAICINFFGSYRHQLIYIQLKRKLELVQQADSPNSTYLKSSA